MNFYENIKRNLRENEENSNWENALNSGKVVNVYDKSGQYTPTKFFLYNGKVYYKNKAISGGSWFEHPQLNQQQLIKHIKGLLNDKEVDYAVEVLDEKPDTLYNNDKEQTSIKLNDEPKGKHYPEGKILRDPDMERVGTNVRDWYMKEFPKDDLGPEIKENITFEDVFDALDRHKDIYDFIGVGDSIVRERIFSELADIIGSDYDYVYNQWLGESAETNKIEKEIKEYKKVLKGDIPGVERDKYEAKLSNAKKKLKAAKGIKEGEEELQGSKVYYKSLKRMIDDLDRKIEKANEQEGQRLIEQRAELMDKLTKLEDAYGDKLNEAEEQNVVKSFKDDKNGLRVDVVKAPNGRFFNYYYSIDKDHWDSNAGPFNSEEEAIKMAKKHRPTVKESQTQEIEGIMNDLRKDIPDIDKYMEDYDAEIAKDEPKPAYDKDKDQMNPEWEKWNKEKTNVLYSEVAWNNFAKWVKDKYGKDINESENLKEAIEQKYRKSNPDYNSFLRDVKKYTGSYDYLYGGKINAELYGQPIAVNYFYWNRPYVGGGNNLEVNVLTPMDALWGDYVQEAIDNGFEKNSETRLSNGEIKKKILEIISSLDKENLDEAELKEDAVDNARADTAMGGVAYDDYQVNFGDKGGDSPMGLFGQVLDKLTELGWSYEMDDKDTEIGIENYSPAGEDLYDYLSYGSNDLSDDEKGKNLIDSIQELAQNFDADEHVEMYVDMRGQRGVPDSIRTLVEDADAIQEMYDELAKEVEALRKGSMNESEKKFWTFKA